MLLQQGQDPKWLWVFLTVAELEELLVGLVLDQERDQLGLDVVYLLLGDRKKQAGYPGGEDVQLGVQNSSEGGFSGLRVDGSTDLDSIAVELVDGVKEEDLPLCAHKNVVQLCFCLRFRHFLFLLPQFSFGLD